MTLLDESCGSRAPSLLRLPPGDLDYELADAVLDWVDVLGMTLFDWQRDVLRRALARRGPKWAAYEVDLVLPRQNGKNEVLIALELAALNVLGSRLVVHSAHEAMTAQKHFNRFRDLADQLPEVEKLLPRTKTRGFYTANGKEHIRFANGAVLDFKTRTKNAGRGFSADLVVLDEAFNLPPQAYGSLMYTLRARKNPQVWKTSSAAHAESIVLHNDRARAVAADPDDSRLLYVEWGNEADCDPSDPDTWLRSNPSVGHTAPGFGLELQTFRNEYASAKQSPELLAEFVREVCGVPEPPLDLANSGPFDMDVWRALAQASIIESHRSWALAVSPDRKWAALGIAGRRIDGLYHVEWMDHRAGTGWVTDRCVEAWQAKNIPIRIHAQGAEATFIDQLRERGVQVEEVSTPEYARATGLLIDAVNERQLRHVGQRSLDRAIERAEVRQTSSGASVFTERGAGDDITTLKAVTVALGGVPEPDAPIDVTQSVW